VTIQFDAQDARLQRESRIAWRKTTWSKTCKLGGRHAKGRGLAFAATLGVKGRLEKSEEHLQAYARRNDLVFLESDKEPSRNVQNEQVQQLQEELTKAQAQRYEKGGALPRGRGRRLRVLARAV